MKLDLRSRTLELTVCSPLHVGSGIKRYQPIDLVALGRQCYKINERKLGLELLKKKRLDDLLIRVQREGEAFRLGGFLEEIGLGNEDFLQRVADFVTTAAPEGNLSPFDQFVPCLRGGFGGAYLPGSSIKGAIRTALLHRVLKQEKAAEQLLNEAISRRGDKPLRPLLQGRLSLEMRDPKKVGPQLKDFLRCLRVSDAHYDGQTELYPVQVLSLRKDGRTHQLKPGTFWLECIPPGSRLRLTLTLDHALLAEFAKLSAVPFRDLADLMAQVTAVAQEVREQEAAFYRPVERTEELQQFYRKTDANLRIGQGSGMRSTTIILRLTDAQRDQLRDRLRNTRRDHPNFPKSRRVVVQKGEPLRPLGWLRWQLGPERRSD